jgi:hypothetical protein
LKRYTFLLLLVILIRFIALILNSILYFMRYLQNQSVGPVTLDKGGNVAIKVQAKPGARCNNVTGTENIPIIFVVPLRLHI